MKPFVVYSTKTGNTKKVAGVIAKELDVTANRAKEVKSSPKESFLIVGSGVYAGKISGEIKEFIEGLPKTTKGRAAVFETSGEGEHTVGGDQMEWSLKQRGYKVVDKFVCPGSMFYVFRRGYPTPKDFENARKFAAGLKRK
jgi:flavodoxin